MPSSIGTGRPGASRRLPHLSGRLRDLVDVALLVESHAEISLKSTIQTADRPAAFPKRLAQRALDLGLTRPLWYSLHFVQSLLGDSGVVRSILDEIRTGAPGPLSKTVMDWVGPAALVPPGTEEGPGASVRLAQLTLVARYYFLRMPLHILILHSSIKSWRAITNRDAAETTV
jgi:hypothetical protein